MSEKVSFMCDNEHSDDRQNIGAREAVVERIHRIVKDWHFDMKELRESADTLKRLSELPEFDIARDKLPFAPELFDYQAEFVRSRARFSAFIGGVRSGKTFAGAVKGLNRGFLLPTTGAVIAPTSGMARDVLVPQYAELAEGRIAKWNASTGDLFLDNGSKILFRSADNPERLMGLTLDWFHLDEAAQLPRRVWEVLVNRTISTGGPGFLTTTPRGKNWLYRLVESWKDDPDAQIFTAKTADNPLIDPEEIDRARRQLDARYFRQQFEASWESDSLRVYEDFSPELHVLDEPWQIRDNWPIYIGIDFGWTHPSAIIWAQLSPDGRWFVFDELVEQHLRLETIAGAILGDTVSIQSRSFRARVPYSRVERVISGAEGLQSRQEAGGESALSALSAMGITRVAISRSGILSGINAVRAKLLTAESEIRLRFDPRCRRVIDDIAGYGYQQDDGGAPAGELPLKDGIHDHSMDALRYMIESVTPLKLAQWRFG